MDFYNTYSYQQPGKFHDGREVAKQLLGHIQTKRIVTTDEIHQLFPENKEHIVKALDNFEKAQLLIPLGMGRYQVGKLAYHANIKENKDMTAQDMLKMMEGFSEDMVGSELANTLDFSRSKLPGFSVEDTVIANMVNPKWECPSCGHNMNALSPAPQLVGCRKCGQLFAGSASGGGM